MAKAVTKNGTTTKTYFLYDGNNVIMEADENGVTAKNTYGGPLLLRTEFNGSDETTYQYMYNAHGDVVTLISEGDVVATYYYDSFGNILDQTGEVDNSILYAGYQYDEETGLYYVNARMYDPVTARFLQADTYLGNTNDPLSLNLYTYCLNNPHKYVDPSGHFAITTALLIGFAIASGILSGWQEYNRQIEEGDNYTNWVSIGVVGVANTLLCLVPGGKAVSAYKAATAGGSFVLKTFAVQFGKAVGLGIASGCATDAGIEVTRQLATGTKLTNLEYDRINEAGVTGAIAGGAGAIFGTGVEALANTRLGKSVAKKATEVFGKGKTAVKSGFAKVASKNGKTTAKSVTANGSSVSAFRNTPVEGTSIYGDRSYYSGGRRVIEGVDPATLKVCNQQTLDPARLNNQRELIKKGIERDTLIKVTKDGVIYDGHHGARAALEVGKYIDVEIVPQTIVPNDTPLSKLPVRGSGGIFEAIRNFFR